MEGQQSSPSIFESSNIASFSENDKFSDICIVSSDDVPFHVHKSVIAANSDYFMAMFASGLKEASAKEVQVQEFDEKILKPILNFLYTEQIDLKNETVQDIMRAANFFQIQLLINKCTNFMEEMLDVKNCLSVAMFADQNGLFELFKKATNFASANFGKVCSCREFLKLEENQLSEIISNENLCEAMEEKIFFNIIKWINHDKKNREKSAANLFSKVRYRLLTLDFIKQHRSKLPYQVECLEIICTWLDWHSSPDNQRLMKPKKSTKLGMLLSFLYTLMKYTFWTHVFLCIIVGTLPFSDFIQVLNYVTDYHFTF